MMSKLLRKSLLGGLAVAVVLSLLVPHVAGQSAGSFPPDFTLGTPSVSPNEPIAPDTGTAQVSIPWTYAFKQTGTELSGVSSGSVTLQWEQPSCTNPNVLITGALAETIDVSGAGPTTKTFSDTSRFNVQVTQDAPGETPILCTFRAKVLAAFGAQVPETETATATANIFAKYLGLLSANVPVTINSAGPQKQIRYDIELSNLGNARSTITFGLNTEVKGGWNPVPPTQIVLESPAQGGAETTKTVGFLVSTPFKNGWNNEETTFQLEITPVSTKDPTQFGQSVSVNVLARVRGVYVPTLEPVVLLGAVVGAAMLARRQLIE